jgi:aminoglycoside 2''-phosphotransferase
MANDRSSQDLDEVPGFVYNGKMDLTPYLEHIHDWNPDLDLNQIRVDPYGLNNLVVMVGDEWVCRFPRTEVSRDYLRREALLLSVISRYVGDVVPEFTSSSNTDFVAYRMLPGKPLYRHDLLRLNDKLQDQFAADLAEFLNQLHSVPSKALEAAGFPSPPMISPAAVHEQWTRRLDEIRFELFPHLWADQHAYIEDLFAPVITGHLDMAAYLPVLIHNDLASYHLLSDPQTGRLTGVLDFGEAGWGDPAADYAVLINIYGESFVQRLGASNPILPGLLNRARFRTAYLELEWALKGIRTNNPEWFLVHLGRARDSSPIDYRF